MELDSILPFSPKARESIRDTGFLTVWEGAVRSSKTIASVYAFLMDVIRSPDQRHLMIGRSQAAVLANCVEADFGLIDLSAGAAKLRRDASGETFIAVAGKRIDMFGGENVSSFKAFRGRTYGSVYIDEVNLQHKNTVAEGFNRTIASRARKHYWTLNPDLPNHWIYKEFIDKFLEDNLPGYRYFHFTLDDNPAITEERKAELVRQYTGIFYKRYILGLRVRAEGIIYKSFGDKNIVDTPPGEIKRVTFGLDFGGNGSATTFCAMGWYVNSKKQIAICVLDEVYDDKNESVESIVRRWQAFVSNIRATYRIDRAFGDSAEQLILKTMRQAGPIHIENAMKRPINDRIRLFDMLFSQGRCHIMRHCKHTIAAFSDAVYDDKADGESRLDNGSSNIDSLDAAEYSVEREMSELIGV